MNASQIRLLTMFILLSLCVIITGTAPVNAQNWEEDKLIMDLQNGGAELFQQVAPSIVQIFNLDYVEWGGGSGSGYVIDKEGHCITNKHVVDDSQVVEVAFFGDEDTGERHKAIVIGCDPQIDLAVIKIITDPGNLHPIKLADSDEVKVGDVVATLGSPGGDAGMVDPGDRRFGNANWLDFFNFNIGVVDEILDFHHTCYYYSLYHKYYRDKFGQYYGSGVQYLFHVSAAINSGNSGGPAINAKGEVIGTNTWGGGGENQGYSVPVNLLKRSTRDIIQYGRVRTPWCGIVCHPPDIPYKWIYMDAELGLTGKDQLWFNSEPDSLLIEHVNPYSPAYEAGLRDGDKILSIDGQKLRNVFDIYKYILNGRIGQEMTFTIERNGTGRPPMIVELDEKKIRYDSLTIDTITTVGWTKPYHVGLTY